jgi:energy-coupling factor transport system substrate-specific component
MRGGIKKVKEAILMWKDTRMIVLTAICAAVYAAVLIPFKIATIIPGFTEIRPAATLPVVFSLMFGPAGAWGAAFGNLIGDFFGTLGPGSFFGFIGNFMYGYIPYKVWQYISNQDPIFKTSKTFLNYFCCVALTSSVCGIFIAWGVDLLGLVPMAILANIIALNNFIVSAILGPFLLTILYIRVKKWRLLYRDILSMEIAKRGKFTGIGILCLLIGSIGGLLVINLSSLAAIQLPINWATMLPAVLLIIIGTILI